MKIKTLLLVIVLILTLTLAACDITTTSTNSTTATTNSTATTDVFVTTTTTTVSTTSSLDTTQRTFTLAQLAVYNGNNGVDAYIAVNGVVYDVTDAAEWTNGWHKGMHLAGTDASAAFADSPHSLAFIQQLPVVGTFVD